MAIMPTNSIPAVSYLIQADDRTNVLIDTGFPRNVEAPSMDLRLDDRDYTVNSIAAMGFSPRDISYLSCNFDTLYSTSVWQREESCFVDHNGDIVVLA